MSKRTIWKFRLDPSTAYLGAIPVGAKLLTVQEQDGDAVLWALVDPKAQVIRRGIGVYGTGHLMPEDPGVYVGTFQLRAHGLVFHVFDEGER